MSFMLFYMVFERGISGCFHPYVGALRENCSTDVSFFFFLGGGSLIVGFLFIDLAVLSCAWQLCCALNREKRPWRSISSSLNSSRGMLKVLILLLLGTTSQSWTFLGYYSLFFGGSCVLRFWMSFADSGGANSRYSRCWF